MDSSRRDQRVSMSAACKRAAERGEAWVTWRGERLRLAPPPADEMSYFDSHNGNMTVVYVRQGRFRVAEIGMRKGGYPMLDASPGGHGYRVQPRQLRALVVERHVASEAARAAVEARQQHEEEKRRERFRLRLQRASKLAHENEIRRTRAS